MEREGEVGEGEGREGRGRREGEMRRGRRGIIVGGMVIGLLMGCNNGGESAAGEKGLSEIGRSVENTFYSFLSLIADTLGFRVTKDTTKQQVGQHFTTLGTKIGEASAELDKVAEKATADGDKEGILSKAVREAVEAAKETLKILRTNIEFFKGIGGDGSNVGKAASNSQGEKPDYEELKKVHKALKGIVTEAVKEGVANPAVGATTKLTANNKDGAKILSTNSTGKPSAAVGGKAAAILATVSGKEMLAEIVNSQETDAEITQAATAETTAMSFARGNNGDHLAQQDVAKAAAVAGGIALRSLVKTGTLASHTSNDDEAVQAAGVTAVKKLLVAVEDIVRKTVKETLKKAKEKIDGARASKATVQQ